MTKNPQPLAAGIQALFSSVPPEVIPADPTHLHVMSAMSLPQTRDTSPVRHARLKLWHLEDKLHCPVVGTCVPLDELAALARRHGLLADQRDAYALHGEAVNRAREKSPFAEALQKFLDRRYHAALQRFEKARSEVELHALWQCCLNEGQVAGPFWAAVSHRAGSAEFRSRVYADIHMLSHQVGAGQAADVRQLAQLKQRLAEAGSQREKERRNHQAREATLLHRVETLQADLARAQAVAAEKSALESRLKAFESGSVMVDLGRRLMALSEGNEQLLAEVLRLRPLNAEIAELHKRLAGQAALLEKQEEERLALESLLLTTADDSPADCHEDCVECPGNPAPGNGPALPAKLRRILCVGGRTQLLTHYRKLAERLGIRLIHHDGGQEESLSRLPDMINGAAAVICPPDCVSHPAYYRLKNQCKRLGKPCFLFKGAGVSSFAAALVRIGQDNRPLSP